MVHTMLALTRMAGNKVDRVAVPADAHSQRHGIAPALVWMRGCIGAWQLSRDRLRLDVATTPGPLRAVFRLDRPVGGAVRDGLLGAWREADWIWCSGDGYCPLPTLSRAWRQRRGAGRKRSIARLF